MRTLKIEWKPLHSLPFWGVCWYKSYGIFKLGFWPVVISYDKRFSKVTLERYYEEWKA